MDKRVPIPVDDVTPLLDVCEKIRAWLDRLAERCDKQAQDHRFESLVDANVADAKNYRAVVRELKAAVAKVLAHDEQG